MRALDIFVLSWRQMKERRLRSILTMLAVAVGVTTIIALSAQVEGVRGSIVESLGKLGPETVILTVHGGMSFTDADVARLKELEGVSTVAPVLIVNGRVTDLESPVTVVGISSFDMVNLLGEVRLLDGSMYVDVPAPQALLGSSLAKDEVGEIRYRAGQPFLVQIGTRPVMMTVVGVLDTYGNLLLIQPEKSIFIPIEYLRTLLRTAGYEIILVKAARTEDVDQVVQLIRYVYGGRAEIMSLKQITEMVINITSMINVLLIGTAGTSFIAAGLGTFNIMMISVLERVREIGILKALGMKDRGVLSLYLIQGLLIGLFGSSVGLVLGFALSYVMPVMFGGFSMGPSEGMGGGMELSFMPIINPSYVVVAMSTSTAITLLSSAYPAWRASRMRPVEALRSE